MKKHLSGRRAGLCGAVSAMIAAVLVIGGTQAAEAASVRFQIINVSSSPNQVGAVFADCRVAVNGAVCTISKGRGTSRDIQLSLGVSRSVVAAGLGISSGSSTTITVGCQSPEMKAGQVWKARSVGTRYSYNVRKQEGRALGRVPTLRWTTVATSGRLTAHNPTPNRISCGF